MCRGPKQQCLLVAICHASGLGEVSVAFSKLCADLLKHGISFWVPLPWPEVQAKYTRLEASVYSLAYCMYSEASVTLWRISCSSCTTLALHDTALSTCRHNCCGASQLAPNSKSGRVGHFCERQDHRGLVATRGSLSSCTYYVPLHLLTFWLA